MAEISNDVPADASEQPEPPRALLSQLNWLNSLDGHESSGVYEHPFYSDTHIISEITDGLGPYSFLNTVPAFGGAGVVNTPIVLRFADHLGDYRPQLSETDEKFYHGGTMVDEIAALTSLCLGARVKAGGEARRFESGKDPYGRPVAWREAPKPIVRVRKNHLVLPAIVGKHSLDHLEILNTIPNIRPDRYVNLIRSCSAYQDALWIAESEPQLAWLMFVSALETAANDVSHAEAAPSDRLREARPDLATVLEESGGNVLVDRVAGMIANTFGATKKFMDFTLDFIPPEPQNRPSQKWLQSKWSKNKLKKTLNIVYGYRSRALHGGIAFPAPMCEAPYRFGSEPSSEKPWAGLGMHSQGGTWLPENLPINLHCFHYITRGALLNWWRTLPEEKEL